VAVADEVAPVSGQVEADERLAALGDRARLVVVVAREEL